MLYRAVGSRLLYVNMRTITALVGTVLAACAAGVSPPVSHHEAPKLPAFVLEYGEPNTLHALLSCAIYNVVAYKILTKLTSNSSNCRTR